MVAALRFFVRMHFSMKFRGDCCDNMRWQKQYVTFFQFVGHFYELVKWVKQLGERLKYVDIGKFTFTFIGDGPTAPFS